MRTVLYLLVLAASTYGATIPQDNELPALLSDIQKEIEQAETDAAELERTIRDENQSDESAQEDDIEENLQNEEPSKERSKKSTINSATVCVEVKPSDPYQKPYTVCHPSPNGGYGSPGGVYVGPPAANYAPAGYGPHPGYGPTKGSAYGPASHSGNGIGHASGSGYLPHGHHAPAGYGAPAPASAGYSSGASSGYGAPAPLSAGYSSAASSGYGAPAPASAGYNSAASSSYGSSAPSSYGSHASSGYGAQSPHYGYAAPSAAYGSSQVLHSSGVSHGSAFGGHNAQPSVHPSPHSAPHYRSRELDGDVDPADAGIMGEDDEDAQGSSLRMAYNPPASLYYPSVGPSYSHRAPAYPRPGYGHYSSAPAPQHVQYSPLGLNHELSSCGVPLMLSCQPRIYQGHAIHPAHTSHYGSSYPAPSYGHGHGPAPSYGHGLGPAPSYGHGYGAVPVSHVTVQPGPGYGEVFGHGPYAPAPSHGGYVPHGSYDIAVGAPPPQLREVEHPKSKHNLHTENKDTKTSQSQVHQTIAASGDKQSQSSAGSPQRQATPGSGPAARQNAGGMTSTPSLGDDQERDGRTSPMNNQQPLNN